MTKVEDPRKASWVCLTCGLGYQIPSLRSGDIEKLHMMSSQDRGPQCRRCGNWMGLFTDTTIGVDFSEDSAYPEGFVDLNE